MTLTLKANVEETSQISKTSYSQLCLVELFVLA